jgi:hypothetical protein
MHLQITLIIGFLISPALFLIVFPLPLPAPSGVFAPSIRAGFPYYLSILALFRNEAPYLAEWIEYHLLVGVDKFWLIDNQSSDKPATVLTPYINLGVVNLSRWPGQGRQRAIYNYWRPILCPLSFWIAVIDIDEFLVPVQCRSIPSILHRFEWAPGLVLNWIVYDSNGQLNRTEGLVIERFRNHSPPDSGKNRHTQEIGNPRRITTMGIHWHYYANSSRPVNTRGEPRLGHMFTRPAVHDLLRVNHYMMKSVEEYIAKRKRGRASKRLWRFSQKSINQIPADIASQNDSVTDDTAMDWAIPLVKASLAERNEGWSLR